MAISNKHFGSIPEETVRVARAIYGRGNLYMQIRDELEGVLSDETFGDLYPSQGRPGISPARLGLVLIMQYIAGYSDRQVVEAVRDKISWKYALGLELEDRGFDASILTDFRDRLMENQAESRLFELVLEHLSKKDFLKGKKKQRTDATHILASVRQLNRLELLGESMRVCLNRLAHLEPVWLSNRMPQTWIDRYSQRFSDWNLPKEASKRQELSNQIGLDGYQILEMIYQDNQTSSHLAQLPEVETLRRIWVQQFLCDEQDQIRLRDVKDTPKGANLIQSPFDIEARFSQHLGDKKWVGYKTHFTENCVEDQPGIITDVQTGKATDNDSQFTPRIQKALIDKGLKPDEHYLDAGYSSLPNFVQSHDNEIELMTPLRAKKGWQAQQDDGLDRSTFFIDWEQTSVTCPNGASSRTWSPSHNTSGHPVIHIRFSSKDCLPCPLKSRCTHAQARSLKLHPQHWHEELDRAQQTQSTPQFWEKYRIRSGIEGTFSMANRMSDLRQSPFLGLQKTHFHCLMSALAINLKRAINWINDVPIATTRKSPLQPFAKAS